MAYRALHWSPWILPLATAISIPLVASNATSVSLEKTTFESLVNEAFEDFHYYELPPPQEITSYEILQVRNRPIGLTPELDLDEDTDVSIDFVDPADDNHYIQTTLHRDGLEGFRHSHTETVSEELPPVELPE